MKLCFDSIEEVKEFVGSLKGTRGKKGEGDEAPLTGTGQQAPAPIMPTNVATAAFQPSSAPAFQAPQGAFPGAPTGDPATAALVTRIVAKIDGALASGQPTDAVLGWFRGQCGPEAASATMDQIKQVFLPKLAAPTLENIAKLMNA